VALGLAVARRGRPLVPVQAEPAQRVDDEVDVLVGGARLVGVLDAQDEGAAVVARVEPVEERRAGATDVQVSGGAGGEAHADAIVRFRHNDVLYPPAAETRSAAGSPGRADEAAHELRAREVVSSARRADPSQWRQRRGCASGRSSGTRADRGRRSTRTAPTPPAASAAAGA